MEPQGWHLHVKIQNQNMSAACRCPPAASRVSTFRCGRSCQAETTHQRQFSRWCAALPCVPPGIPPSILILVSLDPPRPAVHRPSSSANQPHLPMDARWKSERKDPKIPPVPVHRCLCTRGRQCAHTGALVAKLCLPISSGVGLRGGAHSHPTIAHTHLAT